jgi:hypothetical protein
VWVGHSVPTSIRVWTGKSGTVSVMGDMSDMSDIVKVSLGKQLANKP